MARYKAIHLKFAENWKEEYERSERSSPAQQAGEKGEVDVEEDEVDEQEVEEQPRVRQSLTPEEDAEAAKIRMDKLLGRRTTKTPPAKKSS
jgi:hypothetical protein